MSEFVTLVLVTLLAFLAPGMSKRLRMPVVVGEISLGMLVGLVVFLARHFDLPGVGALETGAAMSFLAEIGLIVLLFLAGLEIDFNMIEERGIIPIAVATAVFGATLGAASLAAEWLGYGFFTALILTTTSIGVVVPTLREAHLNRTDYGQNVLITALLIDFGTMLLLTIYVFVHERGAPGSAFGSWVPFLLIPLFFAIFFLTYRLGGLLMWNRPELFSRFFRNDDPTEEGVRASLALMFVFVALSELLGIEAILGAFLAGILISVLFREGALLQEKLYGFGYGFFVPLFFIHLGLTFRFGAVSSPAVALSLGLLFVVLILIKVVPSALWVPFFGVRRVIAMGLLNSSGLTLMIAAATVGLRLGFIDETFFSTIIILAIVTAAVGPVLFRIIMRNDPLVVAGHTPPGGTAPG